MMQKTSPKAAQARMPALTLNLFFALLFLVASSGALAEQKKDFNQQWREILAEEQTLEQTQQRMRDGGLSTQALLSRGEEASLASLREADAAYLEFQRALDAHNQRVLDFFIEGSMAAVNELRRIAEEDPSLKVRQRATLGKLFEKVQTSHESYQKFKPEYGKTKDWLRTQSVRHFTVALLGFMEGYARIAEGSESVKPGFFARARAGFESILHHLRLAIALVPKAFRFGAELVLNRMPRDGKAPLIEAINDGVRTFGELSGYEVEVLGKENLPLRREDGTTNIFVPTHRDDVLDAVTMSNLGVSDYMVFGAPDHFIPRVLKFISNLFERSHSFIVVGRGSGKPMAKVEQEILNSQADGQGLGVNLLIYPEGNVPAGMREGRPPRENFVNGLVLPLMRERVAEDGTVVRPGLRVNLVPITYLNSSRIAGRFETPDQKRLKAVVNPVIPARFLERLSSSTKDPQSINRFLRGVWLETLPTDQTHLFGQLRASVVKDLLGDHGFRLSKKAIDLIANNFDPCHAWLTNPENGT